MIAVVLTLSLGIGANAAIFLVRGVLLKPLVNRDEDRLIYIRQSAPGIRDKNSTFSVSGIQDLRASVKTLSAFGDFFGYLQARHSGSCWRVWREGISWMSRCRAHCLCLSLLWCCPRHALRVLMLCKRCAPGDRRSLNRSLNA